MWIKCCYKLLVYTPILNLATMQRCNNGDLQEDNAEFDENNKPLNGNGCPKECQNCPTNPLVVHNSR